MKYKVIESDSDSLLEQLVNDHLAEGWQPLGGVSVVRWEVVDRKGYKDDEWEYAQALVKVDIPTPLMDVYEQRLKARTK